MAEGLALDVKDLSVTGNEGRPILSLESLSLEPGQCLGVRGPSGAGKTTLIFAIAGLLPRVTGRISWGGIDIAALEPGGRRAFRARHMGLVFQDFLLFDELGPAANAGIFALFSPSRQRAGIRARAGSLLADLGVPTDRTNTTTLSGGERQRVAIARALASNPGILLADEPTAALHREAAERVAGDLTTHARKGGRTLIAASHDDRLLSRMDRVIELRRGVPAAA